MGKQVNARGRGWVSQYARRPSVPPRSIIGLALADLSAFRRTMPARPLRPAPPTPLPRALPLSLLFVICSSFFLAGCVKRSIVIESDPPGARVWINEHPSGITPVTQTFITHGRYKFRLQKTGFRELERREMVRAPIYEWIPLDFIFEILLPVHLEDKHLFRYDLTPEPPSERLEVQKPADVKILLEDLQDSNPTKRRSACLALARMRDPATAAAVMSATHDPMPTVRMAALEALRALLGADAVSRLVEVLHQDSSPEVRWQAAVELEALKDHQGVPALIDALEDRSHLVRTGAAEGLKGIPDPRAVQPLIRALRDKDTSVRRASAEGLGLIGDRAAVRSLTKVLFHHDFQTRRRAAKSLSQLKDPWAAPALVNSLDDWDPELRRIATEAIVQMRNPTVVPKLIRYLHSWKPATREQAAITLGGLKDSRAIQPLRRASIREPNERTRLAMARALTSIEGGSGN